MHISATKWYTVGHGTGALWDLCKRSMTFLPLPVPFLLWPFHDLADLDAEGHRVFLVLLWLNMLPFSTAREGKQTQIIKTNILCLKWIQDIEASSKMAVNREIIFIYIFLKENNRWYLDPSCAITLKWMRQVPIDHKSTLVQVLACCP